MKTELTKEELLEKYKTITDETILIDFENTQKEADAYNKLADEFFMLANLPETAENDKQLYSVRSDNYRSSQKGCLDFLELLVRLADARELDLD